MVKTEPSLEVRKHAMALDVLELLEKNASSLYQHRNASHNSHDFVLIDTIMLLTEEPDKILEIIKLITDHRNGGEEKIAYMYPFLIQEGNKSIVKIAFIRPPTAGRGMPRDASQFCEIAMRDSIPILNRLVSARKKKVLKIPIENPGSLIIKKKNTTQDDAITGNLYPQLISFEQELRNFLDSGFRYLDKNIIKKKESNAILDATLKKAYLEIKGLPMPHALADWLDYLVHSHQITRIENNYYIVYENTDNGFEEIRKHICVHKEALEKHVLPKLAPFVKNTEQSQYAQKKQKLVECQKEKNNSTIREESDIVLQLLKVVPLEELSEKQAGFSIKNIKKCCDILAALLQLLKQAERNSTKRTIRSIINQVFHDSLERKNITPINLHEKLVNAGCTNDEDDYSFLKQSFDELLNSDITYYTHSGNVDNLADLKDLYLAASSHLSVIIANLGESALKNKTFLEPYRIAKTMEKNLLQDIYEHPELNSGLTKQQINTAKELIKEIDRKLNETNVPDKKRIFLFYDLKSALFSIFFFVVAIISAFFIHNGFFLLLLLYPLFAKYIFINPNTKKKSNNSRKIDSVEESANPKMKKKLLEYLRKNIQVDTEDSIISQVIDSNTINQVLRFEGSAKQDLFLKKYPDIDVNVLKNSNKMFKNIFNKEMVTIVFKPEGIPKENTYLKKSGTPFPSELYIKKTDLASSAFRHSLSEFYRKAFAKLIPSETDKQTYYRKIIEILENPREYNKYINSVK